MNETRRGLGAAREDIRRVVPPITANDYDFSGNWGDHIWHGDGSNRILGGGGSAIDVAGLPGTSSGGDEEREKRRLMDSLKRFCATHKIHWSLYFLWSVGVFMVVFTDLHIF